MKNKNNQGSLSSQQLEYVIALYNNGQAQEAVTAIKALNQEYPNVPLLFNILGACYKSLGQFDGALQMFDTATKIKPDYAEAYFNLGVIQQELIQSDRAIISYKKAIEFDSNYPDAHNNLGIIYLNINQLDRAIKHFELAISFKKDFAEAHNNLGSCLQKKGQLENSLNRYKLAISINENYAQAHNNLGILYQKLGRIDDALESYEKAIVSNSGYAEAHFNLSALKKYSLNDSQIAKMQSLLASNELSQSNKIYLCFAMAKVNEDLGLPEELFKFLNEGNKLRKEQLNFSFDKTEGLNLFIRRIFKTRIPEIKKSLYVPSLIKPIFILGMPRSGTSLVEQIISSHHKVYGAGELKSLNNIIASLTKHNTFIESENLSEKNIFSIREKYLESLANLNISENIITDKWPLNFKNIGFILSAFPEAKIVHLKRDTTATCWSIYKHYFSDSGNGWAYNLDDLAQFYNLYEDLMEFWHELYPNKIYDISYEDLTTNQEEETRKLLEYCDLEWDEDCLNFHTNERAVQTASSLQVREKMYQGSSEVWKQYWARIQPLIDGLKSYKNDNKTS